MLKIKQKNINYNIWLIQFARNDIIIFPVLLAIGRWQNKNDILRVFKTLGLCGMN